MRRENYEKGEQGDKFSVYLCNSPVSWSGVHWGSVVVVINNGGSRAYARLSDNESSHHDELTERSVKKQLFENASK